MKTYRERLEEILGTIKNIEIRLKIMEKQTQCMEFYLRPKEELEFVEKIMENIELYPPASKRIFSRMAVYQ